jgi:hypothetical protein
MIAIDKLRKTRLGIMLGAHFVLGLAMAVPALLYPGRDWPGWIQVWFLGLVCSEIMLFGIWAGFAKCAWWLKLLGLAAGAVWLLLLGLSADPDIKNVLPMLGLLGPPMLVVASACLGSRWLVRIEKRAIWQPLPSSTEVQFTLKSLIGLTLIVSLLLALGRVVQWIDKGASGTAIAVCVFVLIALLSTVMLVWACLSQGRPPIRIPLAFVGTTAAGLIYPYYIGGPDWRYLAWPGLMLVIAAYVSVSLLVIRSCGFRLVAIQQVPIVQEGADSALKSE